MKRTRLAAAGLLSLSLGTSFALSVGSLTAGCANNSYGHAVVTQQTGDPSAVIDFQTEISIPEGSVASANVQLVAVDGNNISGSLESQDPSVLLVEAATDNPNVFVFLGVQPGKTTLLVLANGVQVATVPATVTGPPGSSIQEL